MSKLSLDYVVITSVTRDDLEDGGAVHFAQTIREFKRKTPNTALEVLIPDFLHSLHYVVAEEPEVISHNIETVPSIFKKVRPQADYNHSLDVLSKIKELDNSIYTKSGLMVGFGETYDEVIGVMEDLREHDCDIITLGQYARPSKKHIEVSEWVHPDVFEQYKKEAQDMGFMHVESGPYVRSSFRAANLLKKIHYHKS